MRVMAIVKASRDSEAGVLPDEKLLIEMGRFNETRCPNPHPGESEIELRQVFEADDFGAEFTPELREQEERLRKEAAARR